MRFATIMIVLAVLAAGPASAQDVTPPTVLDAEARLELTTNGEPLRVLVDASADEPARFVVTARYRSSYRRFLDEITPHYAYKTAAVGDHVAESFGFDVSVDDFPTQVGPRCYHSDTLTVWVQAEDVAGNRSEPVGVLDEVIAMPLGEIPDARPDGFGWTALQIGGRYPASASVEEWAEADMIVCSPLHIWGSEGDEEAGYGHWIQRVRDTPGSRNVAVTALSGGTGLWNNDEAPVSQRCYTFFASLVEQARAAASPDTNVLTHMVDGRLATVQFSNWTVGTSLVNLTHPVARDTLAWFYVTEWNHADNRLANVGLVFDVWEVCTEYPMIVDGQRVFGPDVIDRDLDGIPMVDDPDGQTRIRDARLAFLRGLRRRLYESAADPAVGRHFLLGGNSVTGRADAEMAALLDHIWVEDLQCPSGCGTGLGDAPWFHGLSDAYVRDEYPSYCQNDILGLPIPDGFSSGFANLAAAMRDSAGGPYVTIESRGTCHGIIAPPALNAVYGLLFDGLYPFWADVDATYDRTYANPADEGRPDLHGLGLALGPAEHAVLATGSHRWQRPYQFGDVTVVMADTSVFRCDQGDEFEYRVRMNGADAWVHPAWGEPAVDAFIVAAWDSAGAGGAVRLDLLALGTEPGYWERSVRVPGGDWSAAVATEAPASELIGYWDTGLAPLAGTLDVRVRLRDQAGLRSAWQVFTVELDRFVGEGVEILETQISGTTYGLAREGGSGYVVIGRGDAPPDAAPPHYLAVEGAVEDGFVPVQVRWSSNLAGAGQGEVGAPWRIEDIPLHRGVNVITITCIDAGGDTRVGAVTVDWDYPGRPGRR